LALPPFVYLRGRGIASWSIILLKVSPLRTVVQASTLPADWESAFDHSATSPYIKFFFAHFCLSCYLRTNALALARADRPQGGLLQFFRRSCLSFRPPGGLLQFLRRSCLPFGPQVQPGLPRRTSILLSG